MTRMILLAAEVTDPLSGGAGWIGAGLLGLVLAWLMLKHLPAKDEQIERLIRQKDEAVAKTALDMAAINKDLRLDFQAALQRVVDHCEREGSKRDASFEKIAVAVERMADKVSGVEDQVHNCPHNETIRLETTKKKSGDSGKHRPQQQPPQE